MPTVHFSLFALLASLIGLAWIFGGLPEAPHGTAARAAEAPGRRTSFAAGPAEEEEEEGGRSRILRKRNKKRNNNKQDPKEGGMSQGQGGADATPQIPAARSPCLYCPFEQEEEGERRQEQGGGGGHEILEFDCAPRVRDAPFRKGGAPVQYIHIMKAGGTAIQGVLSKMRNRLGYKLHLTNVGFKCPIRGSFGAGEVYMGHMPLGWCVAESPARPLYMVSLRDPISRIVSLYDYMATFRGKGAGPPFLAAVKRMRDRETAMEGRGIPSTGFLEHLFAAGEVEEVDYAGLVDDDQMRWLLPASCSSPLDDPRSRLATALTNLLRCDVVVDSDLLSFQLLPQLWYHAQQTTYLNSVGHSNTGHRPKQALSNATVAKILARRAGGLEVEGVDGDLVLYDFARRVARARADRARACWGAVGSSGRNGVDCSALCAINVTATESELIRSHTDRSEQCSPDLSAKGKATATATPRPRPRPAPARAPAPAPAP